MYMYELMWTEINVCTRRFPTKMETLTITIIASVAHFALQIIAFSLFHSSPIFTLIFFAFSQCFLIPIFFKFNSRCCVASFNKQIICIEHFTNVNPRFIFCLLHTDIAEEKEPTDFLVAVQVYAHRCSTQNEKKCHRRNVEKEKQTTSSCSFIFERLFLFCFR